jgi:hypothetical protein
MGNGAEKASFNHFFSLAQLFIDNAFESTLLPLPDA